MKKKETDDVKPSKSPRKQPAAPRKTTRQRSASRAATASATSSTQPPTDGAPERPSVESVEERRQRVALRAYYRAESRGFAPGFELEDWFAAEQEVDATD